jgi:hypothetical protein
MLIEVVLRQVVGNCKLLPFSGAKDGKISMLLSIRWASVSCWIFWLFHEELRWRCCRVTNFLRHKMSNDQNLNIKAASPSTNSASAGGSVGGQYG